MNGPHMIKQARAIVLAGAAACLAMGSAQAAHFVDTGAPNGSAIGAYTFDGTDFFAGQVTFAGAAQISSVFAHVLGGTAGETFSILLYGDSASHLPGTVLRSATATFGVDGWNGVSSLSGWNVGAGSYWIGLELGADDTLGQGSVTGALLDRGVPHPLLRTAFDSGSGYQGGAFDFGLQVDATVAAVPEPETFALMLAGLGALGFVARRRRVR